MPGRRRCRVLTQSKGEADGYHRGLCFNRPASCTAVQNVLVPFEGFHDGRPDEGEESDRQNHFDDHVFNIFRREIP